jgi:uncharacterized membrane protein
MSDRMLRRLALVLAVLGVGIAGYLTYVHYADVAPICNIAHGCIKVQTSRWADLAGVPVAVLGLVGYVLILGALVVDGERGRMAAAMLTVVGFGFSAYLTYREVFSIHAICQWCVASAVVLTLLAGMCVWRLLSAPVPLRST